MPGRSLQVVGYGPVILVSQLLFDHIGQKGCHSAELCMPESILAACVSQELAVGIMSTF